MSNFHSFAFRRHFPVMLIKDCIILSRRSELTIGWELSLPATGSLSETVLESLRILLKRAISSLPPHMMVHRQDIFFERSYSFTDSPTSFIGEFYQKHHSGKRYLNQRSFLYLTLSSKDLCQRSSSLSCLFSKDVRTPSYSKEAVESFLSTAKRFIGMIDSSSTPIRARLLLEEDYIGSGDSMESGSGFPYPGLIPECMSLGREDGLVSGFSMEKDRIETMDRVLEAYVITPKGSSNRTCEGTVPWAGIPLDEPTEMGILCKVPHILNTYILTVDQNEAYSDIEKTLKRSGAFISERQAESMSASGREFLDDAAIDHLPIVLSHNNILLIKDKEDSTDLGSALSRISGSIQVSREDILAPVLFLSSVPGAECEISFENLRRTTLDESLHRILLEGPRQDIPLGAITLSDRFRGIPIRIDFQKRAWERSLVTNFNAFVLGPSGTGKSFLMNHILRCLYDSGQSILAIDIGDSYEGLCSVISKDSSGDDGHYHKWKRGSELCFDPFRGHECWVGDNLRIHPEAQGVGFLLSFLKELLSKERTITDADEEVLLSFIEKYLLFLQGKTYPTITSFHFWLTEYAKFAMEHSRYYIGNGIQIAWFPIDKLSLCLQPFCKDNRYGYLFRSDDSFSDISKKRSRFDVYELGDIASDKRLFPIVVLCILNEFDLMMREDKGFKTLLIDEAWKAITTESVAPYINSLWKTSRKHSASAVVVTQQVSDLFGNDILKDTILCNSSTRILLDQRGSMSEIDSTAKLLGIREKDKAKLLSIGVDPDNDGSSRDVLFAIGDKICEVFRVDVSPLERQIYESEKQKKRPLSDILRSLAMDSLAESDTSKHQNEDNSDDSSNEDGISDNGNTGDSDNSDNHDNSNDTTGFANHTHEDTEDNASTSSNHSIEEDAADTGDTISNTDTDPGDTLSTIDPDTGGTVSNIDTEPDNDTSTEPGPNPPIRTTRLEDMTEDEIERYATYDRMPDDESLWNLGKRQTDEWEYLRHKWLYDGASKESRTR